MRVVNVSLLGHKDHGKSTLIGSLLMQTGAATKVRMREAEKYSKHLGKAFEPAFILDSFAEERTGEMTIDTTRAEIKHKNLAFELIDVPGHEELIKNMMSGASYGEIALLLVSVKKDEGIRDQTKRHLFLSRMFGIDSLVVAVNKMDLRNYDEKAFLSIKNDLHPFIEGIGFDSKKVHFVPISAYTGENLTKKSNKMEWYKGKSLIDLLVSVSSMKSAHVSNQLRVIMQGDIPGVESMVAGKIISGSLKVGERIVLLPVGVHYVVREAIVKGKHVKSATVGENVALRFNKDIEFDCRGSVLCNIKSPARTRKRIDAVVFLTKKLGTGTRIRFNGNDVACTLKVYQLIDPTTGKEVLGTKVKPLNAARANLELETEIVVEPFERLQELGRFVLYDNKGFAGIGTVTS